MKSIIQSDGTRCYICGRTRDLQTHHVFGGANRPLADKDGLTVTLCMKCHADLHDHRTMMDELRSEGQRKWRIYYGKTVEDFRERYGKSYEQ